MSLIEYIQEAIIIFKRKTFRTVLAILCIALGFVSIITILTISISSSQYINNEFSKLNGNSIVISSTLTSTNIDQNLNLDDSDYLSRIIPQIKNIQVTAYLNGNIISNSINRNAIVYGVQQQYNQFNSIDLLYGRFINEMDNEYKGYYIVISNMLANKLFNSENCIGEKIELKNNFGTISRFQIVGVYDNPVINDEESSGVVLADEVFIPLSTLQEFYNTRIIQYIQFKIDGQEEEFKEIGKKAVSYLELKHGVEKCFFASNSIDAKKQYTNLIKIVTSIFIFFGSISIILGGVNLANILLISVKERYREIGIRKSVGANNSQILMQFLVESILITIIGGFFGTLIGYEIGNFMLKFMDIECVFQMKIIFFSIIFNVLVAIIFGMYPAYIATKLNPIDAVKEN